MSKIKFFSCACIFGLLGNSLNASEKKLWTPLDTLLIKEVESIRVSPEGSQTLLRVVEPSSLDRNPQNIKSSSNIYIISNETKEKKLLDDEQKIIVFDWSPDGKWIVYITNNESGNTVWVQPAPGGKAKQIFKLPVAGNAFAISPDNKKIIIGVSVVQNTPTILKDSDSFFQLYLLSFVDKHFKKPKFEALTPATMNVSDRYDMIVSWSPDSRYITFSTEKRDWRGEGISTLAILDVETKKIKELLSDSSLLLTGVFSPDQKHIAYIKDSFLNNNEVEGQQHENERNICLYGFQTKKNHCLLKDISSLTNLVGWSEDSKSIFYSKWDKTKLNIHQINIEGEKDAIFNNNFEGVVSGCVLSHHNKYMGFIFSDMTSPKEAYFSQSTSFNPHQLTKIQSAPTLKWLKSEVIKWKSFDDFEIEGILTYPAGYTEGTKVPLVIWIHGGPAGISNEEFQGDTSFGPFSPAVLASEGYAVFQPNYRGSMGYGDEFSSASFKKLGQGDYKDILSGVDYLIGKDIVDPERLLIGGWSYGGYMSAWAIGHTKRFKAAIVGAGPIDWYSNVAASDNSIFEINYMGKNIKDWFKMSPLMTVKNINTPVLIQQGVNDGRVPMINAVEFSYALKRLNVPYKTLLYQREGHGFGSYLAIYQAMNDQLEWIKKYIRPYERRSAI